MTAKKELERIIESEKYIYDPKQDEVVKTEVNTQDLAEAILAKLPELGFVKLEDVEIDDYEIKQLLIKDMLCENLGIEGIRHIAQTISEAKGIIKVKNGNIK